MPRKTSLNQVKWVPNELSPSAFANNKNLSQGKNLLREAYSCDCGVAERC